MLQNWGDNSSLWRVKRGESQRFRNRTAAISGQLFPGGAAKLGTGDLSGGKIILYSESWPASVLAKYTQTIAMTATVQSAAANIDACGWPRNFPECQSHAQAPMTIRLFAVKIILWLRFKGFTLPGTGNLSGGNH